VKKLAIKMYELDPIWTPFDRGLYCSAFVGYILLYMVYVRHVMAIPTPSIEFFVSKQNEEYNESEEDGDWIKDDIYSNCGYSS